jgi:anaerobic magnesium-protoporphyrin IX monomethyl ester cyclase
MGAESGSQRILDAMDKGTTVAQVHTARQRLGDAGIRACFFVQLGYPGETWEDIVATRELIRDALPDDVGISVSYPLPGTRFHRMVATQLGEKTNWDSSGDLEMMFAGTYTTPFYRQLHLALHDDLDLHRRKAGLHPSPHATLPEVDLDQQEARVAAAWAAVDALEQTCRNTTPTVLHRVEPAPAAPDLSLPYN